MDGRAYLDQVNARVEKIRRISAVVAFLMAVASVIAGAVFNLAPGVVLMSIASVTGGVFSFYLLARRMKWGDARGRMTPARYWVRISYWSAALIFACLLVAWMAWRFGAVAGAWSFPVVLGSEFLLGRELARLAASRGGAAENPETHRK